MERLWWSRLRWRLRGAWLWPTFAALTCLDAALLHVRPLSGESTALVPAFLLAGFLNVGVLAVVAPLAARLLRRRRPDLPRVVAADAAGTVLLGAVTLGLAIAGQLHHAAVVRERRATAEALALMRAWVETRAPAEARRHVQAADTIRVDPGRLYRSCIPTARPARPYCVVVRLDTEPPRVLFDGREPNASWAPRGGY